MSRLNRIKRRMEFNERAEFSNCSAIHCPQAKSERDLLTTVTWDCTNCIVVTQKRFDDWMKELGACPD